MSIEGINPFLKKLNAHSIKPQQAAGGVNGANGATAALTQNPPSGSLFDNQASTTHNMTAMNNQDPRKKLDFNA